MVELIACFFDLTQFHVDLGVPGGRVRLRCETCTGLLAGQIVAVDGLRCGLAAADRTGFGLLSLKVDADHTCHPLDEVSLDLQLLRGCERRARVRAQLIVAHETQRVVRGEAV